MWSAEDFCQTASKNRLKSSLWCAADWYYFDPNEGESMLESATRAKSMGMNKMYDILIKANELGVSF